jgi:hypothetical protein
MLCDLLQVSCLWEDYHPIKIFEIMQSGSESIPNYVTRAHRV